MKSTISEKPFALYGCVYNNEAPNYQKVILDQLESFTKVLSERGIKAVLYFDVLIEDPIIRAKAKNFIKRTWKGEIA